MVSIMDLMDMNLSRLRKIVEERSSGLWGHRVGDDLVTEQHFLPINL